MGGPTIEAPPPRNYAQETRDTLQAQVDLAPQRYAADATYGPKYASLNTDNLIQALRGTADHPGLLAFLQSDIAPALSAQRAGAAEGDISTVERLGGRAVEAFKAANPEQAALMGRLNSQALDELNMDGLDPATQRQVEQASRSAAIARGGGYGVADAAREAMSVGSAGQALRDRRRQWAAQVAGMDQATSVDPFLALLGRSAQNAASGNAFIGQGGALGGQGASNLFNPESQYSGDIYQQNANAAMSARVANASNSSAFTGALMGMIGGIGGGIGQGWASTWGGGAGKGG